MADELFAMLAIIGQRGRIISADAEWRDSAAVGRFPYVGSRVGSNYLELCDRAEPNSLSAWAAAGIREVLGGRRERFGFEYERATPGKESWCRITVARLDEKGRVRALLAHQMLDEVIGASVDLKFGNLFADLSASLVETPMERIDEEIGRWLPKVGVALRVDRVTIGLLDSDNQALTVSHQWVRDGFRGNPIGLNVSEAYPWLAGTVAAGESVVISSEQELPPAAAADLARAPGFGSTVAVPLRGDGVVEGGIAFGSVARRRVWSPRSVRRMRLIADVFGSALRRRRIGLQNRRLVEEIRKVSRVAMMGELTAALAHELNQPLGAILNNARAAQRLLAVKSPDLKEIAAALDDIVRDNARAVAIIQNVRSIFEPGRVEMSPLDLKQILQDVSRIVSAEAKMKNISLSLNLPESLPSTVGDKSQLVEAVLNLVLNAFDAVCGSSEGPREVVMLAGKREPGYVQVSVRDSGKGIDPQAMGRLFETFFTTKPTGMGMGLAIARSIVEKHGGRLWAAQNPDRGATLEFILPVQTTAEAGN